MGHVDPLATLLLDYGQGPHLVPVVVEPLADVLNKNTNFVLIIMAEVIDFDIDYFLRSSYYSTWLTIREVYLLYTEICHEQKI